MLRLDGKKIQKKKIVESIKKIKDSGDETKISYVLNLYRYYCILLNLDYLLSKHSIIKEKEVKYHCEDFYHYLEDNVVDSTSRIITAIISAVANDEPLDSFHKYLMFPHLYEEEYRREEELKDNIMEQELV